MVNISLAVPIRLAAAAILFAGSLTCGAHAAQGVAASYAPSSALVAKGSLVLGPFVYDPALTGKVDANQVRNSALGGIYIDVPFAEFYSDALRKELRLTGVTLDGDNRILTGEIKEFYMDDLGYSIDWILDVHFTVKDKSGVVLYDADKLVKNHTVKYFAPFNKEIKFSIEALISDPAFLKAIN
jgi:uncharacterized lipoprotein